MQELLILLSTVGFCTLKLSFLAEA